MTGDMEDELYTMAVNWFQKKQFATFRFNFYGFQKDARQLMDSTIKIQSSDLDRVVKYFRNKGVKKIFIVAHSFSGPVVLSSVDRDFDAVVFWDPTYRISFTKGTKDFPSGKYIKEVDAYAMHWGVNILISRALAKEVDSFPWNTITKDLAVPLKIIIGDNSELKGSKKYLNVLKAEKEFEALKGGTHTFNDSDKIREALFKSTYSWFKKFLK